MSYLNQLFLLLINIVFFISCTTNLPVFQSTDKESISIEKPKISYVFKRLPNEINILFSDSNKDEETKEFLKGFSVNYYFYKNSSNYQPQINFINLDKLRNLDCKIGSLSKNYSIVFLNKRLSQGLPKNNCLDNLSKLKGIIVLSNNDGKVNSSNLLIFNVNRKEDYYSLLNYAKGTRSRNSIIIDDENTKDKETLAQIWMNLDGNVLSSSTSGREQNEKLLSDLLLRENSKSRARKLSRVLSIPLEATPRRRNDIDSLILSVSLSKARSLKPALEYNYGESIPVYLFPDWRNDEHYFNKEIDLEGTVLIDMPWMLGPSSTINEKIEQSKTRNFAVGYDVYELILLLNNSSGIRNLSYDGMSGRIIQNQGKLIRHSLKVRVEEGNYKIIGF